MIRLLYISTAREALTDAQIYELLATSRANNRRNRVTGLLIVGKTRFLQLLEGEESAVEATYARICSDPRHFAVVDLGRKPASEPLFPDWDMGYESVASGDGAGGLVEAVSQMVGQLPDPSLRAELLGFAEIQQSSKRAA